MSEQYEKQSVAALRALAKQRGISHISALKKGELIEVLVQHDAAGGGSMPESAGAEEAEKAQAADTQSRREEQAERFRGGDSENGREARTVRTQRETENGRMQQERPRMQQRRDNNSSNNGRGRQQEGRQEHHTGVRTPGREQTAASSGQERQERRPVRSNAQPSSYTANRPVRNQSAEGERSDRVPTDLSALDSGETAGGILEIMADGYGFLRSNEYLSGENDIYVAPSQIRRFLLRTGDYVSGNTRIPAAAEKYRALLYVKEINGMPPAQAMRRPQFENMTPVFPDRRLRLERSDSSTAMRIVDLISPVGRGQRGMIVSPPKAGKTTLLKDMARSILANEPDMHIMIMLIDERPEEVTDIREAIVGPNVEVLYSTFDEQPEHHMKVAEMGIERAKRMVEYGYHVTILLDSITRLARAYNLTVQPSGRTLSGGLDPAALYMPKRFFGAARNMREGGSLTILATALVDTGSKMDDVVYEEFKGTGNMELVLDRKLSERRVFPAIDIQKSGTRREDLLLSGQEQEAVYIMRKALNSMKGDEAVENILNLFVRTGSNEELVNRVRRQHYV